ncbi:MAG: hypothetical protein ACRERC_06595 [Candidatus Binatia bacterium]
MPAPEPSAGGCPLALDVDGSVEVINTFDASASFDPRPCGQDPSDVSYNWEVLYPPLLQGGPYTSVGISGYLTPGETLARPEHLWPPRT